MKIEVKFDYISATFPLYVQGDDSERKVQEDVLLMIAKYLNIENFEMYREDFSTNRFKYQYTLADNTTLRLAGAVNSSGFKTCQLEMKGQGCRDFETRNPDKTWSDLFHYLLSLNAVFRRIDIAIDDYTGDKVTIEYIYNKLIKKHFSSAFISNPSPIGTLENGMTLRFGSKQSPIELVIYDKKKEQQVRRQTVEHDYWARYELRFRGDKAQSITELLLLNFEQENNIGFNLLRFSQEQLYRLLDLKIENNHNRKNQIKVETDPNWLDFLDNVQKGTLESKPKIYSDYEKHYNYAADKGIFILMIKYLTLKRDKDLFITEVFRMMYKHSELTKERFYRLNKYLKELGQPVLTDEELEELQIEFFVEVEQRELPF